MIPVKIFDETAPLEVVILGTAENNGPVPIVNETYDPKSRETVLTRSYPAEVDLREELDAIVKIFEKHGVKVLRPNVIQAYNQVFSRDIAFVLGEQLVVPRVTRERKQGSDGIQHIINQVADVVYPDASLQMEGGDVIPWKGNLFVGYSDQADFTEYAVARTSRASLDYLKATFSKWVVHGFELVKSDTNPRENVLHLDCCFQPLGKDKAVIYPEGFKNSSDVQFLVDFFGKDNIIEVTKEEAYEMYTNLFSINPKTVLSDSSFTRLNEQLKMWGFTVEEVKFREVSRMGGSFRCTTLPLRRRYG